VRTNIAFFDVDQRPCTLSVLANVLWLQGFPDQAKQTGIISIDEARASEHPISLCLALKWGGATISLKTGDLTGAERTIAALIEHAEKHGPGHGLRLRHWLTGPAVRETGRFR
jgi:hypothetical protein